MGRGLAFSIAVVFVLSGCAAGGSSFVREGGYPVFEGMRPGSVKMTPPADLKPGKFTLDNLYKYAVNSNPAVLSEMAKYDEAVGRVRQAGLWPNPSVQLWKEMLDYDSISMGDGLTKLNVRQDVDLGGRISARTAEAGAEAEVVRARIEEAVRAAVRDLEKRFFVALMLQEKLELAKEEYETASRLASLAKEKFEAGRVAKQEYLKFEVAAAKSKLSAESLKNELAAACRRLEKTAGFNPGTVLAVRGAWPGTGPPAKSGSLAATLANHPRHRAADSAAAAAKLSLDRAGAEAWPDLGLILMGARDDEAGENYLGFGIGVQLPVFNRNQGARDEAAAKIKRMKQALRAEQIALKSELAAAAEDFKRGAKMVDGYDRDVIPKVEETYRLSYAAYEAGRTSYIEALDSLLELIRSRRERLDYLHSLAEAAVELKYLTGMKWK